MNSEQLDRAIRLWKQAFAIRRWLPGPLAACEYASQGLSVYWLWLELDEHSRKGLTVAAVQQAEQRLLEWLKQPDSIAAEAR